MEERPDSFARQVSTAARAMQSETGIEPTLEQAVLCATQVIDGCDLVGISVVNPDGGVDTPVASDEATRRIDELQYTLKEGPCRRALLEHHTVHCTDLAHDDRWPRWGSQISAELGVGSSLSYRLFVTGRSLGALNLYSREVDGFDTDDVHNAAALASHVAVALAAAQRSENLERALVNRTAIGQAEGILMERFDLSADQAFAVLTRVSQQRNIKLHKVADEVVRTRQIPH